ncbi:DUF4383 domain-containing protein [Amycolatopsis sp. 195334CR]|uniref:DUF4383 domain-containing protein n=1 Tax=Amycolatopsis sp. 195334CR TaxID=2814588 RepID=UPI001A8D2072|nr:DUF4383 domain-containing protein [Amycolatopsis sp. 195334CR]MBN6041470.1 DUF4383 domain-containing protein [Amycolatopsis sp. 195334CR]
MARATTAKTLRPHRAGLQPVQLLAGLVGLAFLVFGIVGLVRTGFGDFAGHSHGTLLGFAINPFHNVLHVLSGLLGVLMATASGLARTYGWLLLIGYGAVFVWGLMITGVIATNPISGMGDPLHINAADNWLHGGLALLGLVMALLPARKVVRTVEEVPAETTGETPRETTGETTAVTEPVTDRTARNEPATAPISTPKHRRWDLRTR